MARRLPQPPRGQPPPGAGRPPRSLGLGLGLGARQRAGFMGAAQGGRSGQWLAAHPGVQQRVNRMQPGGMRETRMQNFMGTGQSQKPPRPPVAGGYAGGNMFGRRQGAQRPQYLPMQPQLPPQHPLMQSVNPGMQSVINNRLGQGLQGMQGQIGQGYTGDNANMQ